MALGDGITWVETAPTDASAAKTIDDYTVQLMKGVRLRMANEHVWPSSQTGTAEAGMHSFVSLQSTTAPSVLLAGTQKAAIAVMSSGTGYELSVCTVTAGTTAGEDIQLTRNGKSQASCIRTTTADPASPIVGEIWFRSDL
jgi:hypothetical protein